MEQVADDDRAAGWSGRTPGPVSKSYLPGREPKSEAGGDRQHPVRSAPGRRVGQHENALTAGCFPGRWADGGIPVLVPRTPATLLRRAQRRDADHRDPRAGCPVDLMGPAGSPPRSAPRTAPFSNAVPRQGDVIKLTTRRNSWESPSNWIRHCVVRRSAGGAIDQIERDQGKSARFGFSLPATFEIRPVGLGLWDRSIQVCQMLKPDVPASGLAAPIGSVEWSNCAMGQTLGQHDWRRNIAGGCSVNIFWRWLG